MSDVIPHVAKELREARERQDAVSEATREVRPYARRVKDALGALRALVTDETPTALLESDLRVVQGIVAALIGGEKATQVVARLPEIRREVATDVQAAFEKDPSATSYGEIMAAYPSILAVSTYRIAHVFYQLEERVVARIMSEDAHTRHRHRHPPRRPHRQPLLHRPRHRRRDRRDLHHRRPREALSGRHARRALSNKGGAPRRRQEAPPDHRGRRHHLRRTRPSSAARR